MKLFKINNKTTTVFKYIFRLIILLSLMIVIYSINICNTINKSLAVGVNSNTHDIFYLNTDEVSKDEEVSMYVDLENTTIKSLTLNVFFDNSKLEYIDDSENTNYINNMVIYTYTDLTNADNLDSITSFTFKAKDEGIANIVITGMYYDEYGNEVEINDYITEVEIASDNDNNIENIQEAENADILDSDSTLKIMRLNLEGITPIFDPNVFKYYIVTNENIFNLDLDVVANNANSTIEINGNSNFVYGVNVITINVISPDKTVSEYKIYLTKTTDLELSNANLENLAINNAYNFAPDFEQDTLKYTTTVSNDITNLEILAISQNMDANVNVIKPDELIVGDNTITIEVLAADDTTKKVYEVIVHRQSISEDLIRNQEYEANLEKLSTLIDDENININEEYSDNTEENSISNIDIIYFNDKDDLIVYVVVSIIVVSIYIIKYIKKK